MGFWLYTDISPENKQSIFFFVDKIKTITQWSLTHDMMTLRLNEMLVNKLTITEQQQQVKEIRHFFIIPHIST